MTKTKTKTNADFTVDQIVTIAPMSTTQFVVAVIDDLSDDMIYVEPVAGEAHGQWVFVTYVEPVKEQEDAQE